MKASELRIGNYVKIEGKRLVLEMISIESESYKYLQPIPLTEEWLVKLGFLAEPGKYGFRRDIITYYVEYKRVELFQDLDLIVLKTDVQYVHQLQNLYFALTGEELTIK